MENGVLTIVLDGIYYALALTAAGGVVAWAACPWFASPLLILAVFCLYFFRDPDAPIPAGPVAVSPADGKVVAVKPEGADAQPHQHLPEHLRRPREPHAHRRRDRGVQYQKGKFLVASREEAPPRMSKRVTVDGDGTAWCSSRSPA